MSLQVSRLGELPRDLLRQAISEIERAELPWVEEYSVYQSGGWFTVSLWNETGNSQHNVIGLCKPIPTELTTRLPAITALVESLRFDIIWARLGCLEPDSFLWEHVDYVEFGRVDALRIHVPLITNPEARLIIGSRAIHMQPGYVWKLDPRERHGAANLGASRRIHVIVDCRRTPALTAAIGGEQLPSTAARTLPNPSDDVVDEALRLATALMLQGQHAAAEKTVLRLYHRYSMPPGKAYELLIAALITVGDEDRARVWRERKQVFLGGTGDLPPNN